MIEVAGLTALQFVCLCFQLGGHDLELIRERRRVLRHFEQAASAIPQELDLSAERHVLAQSQR